MTLAHLNRCLAVRSELRGKGTGGGTQWAESGLVGCEAACLGSKA